MAVAPLNLTPQLRPWHAAGLGSLLLGLPLREFLAVSRQAAQTVQAEQTPPLGPAKLSSQPSEYNTTHEFSSASLGLEAPVVARRPQKSSNAPASDTTPASAKPAALTVQDLPAPWQQVLQKVTPAPIAWVYPELGQDLLLKADSSRSQALRGIIAGLQLKKGSSTFWPASLPSERDELSGKSPGNPQNVAASKPVSAVSELSGADNKAGNAPAGLVSDDHQSAALFRFGLDALGVKFVIALGPQALANTDYADLSLRPFSEQLAGGRLILALPDFAEITSGQAKLENIIVFLRAVFSRYFF